MEEKSSVPVVSVSKKQFVLRKDSQQKITCTVTPPDKASVDFFHSRILFKSEHQKNRPFAKKTAWIFGRLDIGHDSDEELAPRAPTEHLQTLDPSALCDLMTAAKMTKDFKMASFLTSLALAALLNDDRAAFGEILEALRNSRAPSNLAELFEAAAKRSPSSEEAEFFSCENAKKTIPFVMNIFNELARTNVTGLLFRNILCVRCDFRQKKDFNICHLLDGMEGAMRVCQSFAQKINPEASRKIAALASGIREAKIQPVRDDLKVFCALSLCLKSNFFPDPCAFSVGVLLESCIQAAKNKSFDRKDICKMIAVRQEMLDRQPSYRGKSVEGRLESIEKVLSKPPNWKSNQETCLALTEILEATTDLMDALRPEPDASESRAMQALCLALSTNPVTAALGCTALCSLSLNDASTDCSSEQTLTEAGDIESSHHETSEVFEEPGSIPEKDGSHCVNRVEEKNVLQNESDSSEESIGESVNDSSDNDGIPEDEGLNLLPEHSLAASRVSQTEIGEIAEMIKESLSEIDEDFRKVTSAMREANEKVLSKSPNWKSNQETSLALTEISEATADLTDALRPEPDASESRAKQGLSLAPSTNPVTAALGYAAASSLSLNDASKDCSSEQNLTEAGDIESSLHETSDVYEEPGSIPEKDESHCVNRVEEKNVLRNESDSSEESIGESVKDSSDNDGIPEDEDLDLLPEHSLAAPRVSQTEIEKIAQMVMETLSEIDEDFRKVTSAMKEMNGVSSIHLDSLLVVLRKSASVVEQLHRVVGVIFQKTTWEMLSKKLPDSVLKRIVTTSGCLYQILLVFESEWKKRPVKGKFSDRFLDLKTRIMITLDTMLESMVADREFLRKELKEAGLNLKLKNFADDFEVKTASNTSLQPCKTMRERQISSRTKTKFCDIDVKGHIAVKETEGRKQYADGTDLVAWMEGGSSTEPLEHRQRKLISDTVLRIDNLSLHDVEVHKPEMKTSIPTAPDFSATSTSRAQNAFNVSQNLVKRRVRLTAEQMELMRRRCKHQLKDISDKSDAVHNVARYRDPEELPQVEQEELKYLLLARITRGPQSRALAILTRAKDEKGRKRAEVAKKQEIKFVFLVDNSGSMCGEKMTLALTLLVVLLEAMKRLEFATAVVRFGGEESQKVLKSFTDKMDSERGQYIIESFDSSEKTLAADAVQFVAEHEKLYGKDPDRNEHRFIVLITDGIWSQSRKEAYETALSTSKASMMVLTTNPSKDKDLKLYNLSVARAKSILDSIAPGAWFGIDAEKDLSEQIGPVAAIFDRKIREVLLKASANEDTTEGTDFEVTNLSMAVVPQDLPKSASLQYTTPGVIEWGSSVYASNLQTSQAVQAIDENLNASILEKVSQGMEAFARNEADLDDTEVAVDSRAKIIASKEDEWSNLVSDLSSVLDTSVLPNNRPTRAMQDYHGPSFSLRGFIRFICTDGQYKKIYENVIGHPRKDYCVSVVLDTSTSMCGMTAVGSTQAFVGLSAALHESGVSFGLLTAGAETRLIKDLSEEWGPVAKARAHAAIKFEDAHSNVADAILYASHLVQQSASARTVKIVLVITDGFDSAPKRLRQSLSVAEAQDVMVVGIGIGYFTEAVFDRFSHYVVVNDPRLLPRGLHRLFSGEGSSQRPMREFIEEDKHVELGGRVLSTAQEVWDQEMRKVYEEVVERNRAALYLTVSLLRQKCNVLSMDVCFVMDTTGSMTHHLRNAQQYVVTMANDIKANVATSGKEADLRMAFVTYKFFGNQGHLENHAFSDNIDSVMTTVNRMQASGGGGNEDKFGGLRVAMGFDWRAAAKFLVLIGDKPDHILYCPGCDWCRYDRRRRSQGGILELVQQMARQKIYLLYVRITEYTREEEIRVENTYRGAAPTDMKEKGFTLLDITTPGSADALMSMISNIIDRVIAEEFM